MQLMQPLQPPRAKALHHLPCPGWATQSSLNWRPPSDCRSRARRIMVRGLSTCPICWFPWGDGFMAWWDRSSGTCFGKCLLRSFWRHRNHINPVPPARGVTHPVVLGHSIIILWHRPGVCHVLWTKLRRWGMAWLWSTHNLSTTEFLRRWLLGWEYSLEPHFLCCFTQLKELLFIFFQIRIVSGLVPSTLEAPFDVWVVFSLLIMNKLQYAWSCWIVPWHLQNRLPQSCQPPKSCN